MRMRKRKLILEERIISYTRHVPAAGQIADQRSNLEEKVTWELESKTRVQMSN